MVETHGNVLFWICRRNGHTFALSISRAFLNKMKPVFAGLTAVVRILIANHRWESAMSAKRFFAVNFSFAALLNPFREQNTKWNGHKATRRATRTPQLWLLENVVLSKLFFVQDPLGQLVEHISDKKEACALDNAFHALTF